MCGLTHCAFTLIAKAGTVVDRELLEETLPVSWELLLDGDQQLVSAAGKTRTAQHGDLVSVIVRACVYNACVTQASSAHSSIYNVLFVNGHFHF